MASLSDIRPWEPKFGNQGVPHTYHDIAVVTPPSYDTNFQPTVAGVITGRVTDREGGTGIADASVLLRSGSVIVSGNTLQLSTDAGGGLYDSSYSPRHLRRVRAAIGLRSGPRQRYRWSACDNAELRS